MSVESMIRSGSLKPRFSAWVGSVSISLMALCVSGQQAMYGDAQILKTGLTAGQVSANDDMPNQNEWVDSETSQSSDEQADPADSTVSKVNTQASQGLPPSDSTNSPAVEEDERSDVGHLGEKASIFQWQEEDTEYQGLQNNFEEESLTCSESTTIEQDNVEFLKKYPGSRYAPSLNLMDLFAHYRGWSADDENQWQATAQTSLTSLCEKMYSEYLCLLQLTEGSYGRLQENLAYPPYLIHCADFEEIYKMQREFLRRYPKGIYAKDVERLALVNYHRLAAHQIWLALYFYHKGQILLAANTAYETFLVYRRSFAAIQALGILAICYEKLNLTELAQSARQLFELNQAQLLKVNIRKDSCFEWLSFAQIHFPSTLQTETSVFDADQAPASLPSGESATVSETSEAGYA